MALVAEGMENAKVGDAMAVHVKQEKSMANPVMNIQIVNRVNVVVSVIAKEHTPPPLHQLQLQLVL